MKSVLISIKPEWVEKITSGKKTIEVRKSAPKEVPFKAYIYCSYGDMKTNYYLKGRGKVIGEFICDKVMFLTPLGLRGFEMREEILKLICLTNDDLNAYGGLKTLYGWHISDLKIYDKPKKLSEFCIPCKTNCEDCEKPIFYDCWKEKGKIKVVTRPPQSWQYVEELENEQRN